MALILEEGLANDDDVCIVRVIGSGAADWSEDSPADDYLWLAQSHR